MPHNESNIYMEKHSKHDSSAGGHSSTSTTSNTISNATTNRETKNSSPVFLVPAKKNDSPLFKYQGQKWEQVFDFDKMLKQIRNAERHYFRGRSDCTQANGGKSSSSSGNYARRIQPQVQRLNAGDMHFYGMVPKKPFDVVVCDICLGIYTKMGFNNHMRLQHTQAWNSISSKAIATPSGSKDNTASSSENNQEITREISATSNPLAESTANATPTSTSSANNSRHKSSKSGSSGGRNRSRSKSKHHHHHQTSTTAATSSTSNNATAAAASGSTSAAGVAQASSTSTELPTSHAPSSSKSSKKGSASLSNNNINIVSSSDNKANLIGVPKQETTLQPTNAMQSSSSSNLSNSLPAPPKLSTVEMTGLPEVTQIPIAKEKTKTSKRKSKKSANIAPVAYAAPEINESSNSSMEFSSIASNSSAITTANKSSKRSAKAKGGKDLKQLLEPQISELDQAVSSITGGQLDALGENTNSNDRENVVGIAVANNSNTLSFNSTDGSSIQLQMPMARQAVPSQQSLAFNTMQIMAETNGILQQQQQPQPQLTQQSSTDNDSSMLTLDDMLDSKFIHEILNTDESEIHFDESELDKAQQQQQQPAYMQQTPNKRMRYDERLTSEQHVLGQQSAMNGKFAAFQQQQQQQLQQPSFQVTNLDDIKMYTNTIDAQQYLPTQPQQLQQQQQMTAADQHQITTIDTLQLQQLLYQQQQQQQNPNALNAYAVDDMNAAANLPLEQQQQYNNADVIMCSAEQLHKEGKINAADYATLTALSNSDAYSSMPNSICNVNTAAAAAAAAAAAQFQVYNIPSLTDDDDDVMPNAESVTNILEENKLNSVIVPQNHYVLPADGNDEEQLIYEITANNHVALISQQRQQQMIAEFLTQAGYDNMENVNMNINANGNAVLTQEAADIKPITNDEADDDANDDIMSFDFSRLETVTSISSSSSASSAENKTPIKQENRNEKLMSTAALPDDMFLNVFLYAGLPRPMAMNSFGLVKLPQSVATTFRKNLHATRKANNSPVYSLSGSGSPAVTTRFGSNGSNVSTKSSAAQNYFTTLGANAASGGFAEFSNIGSVTVTNQPTSAPQAQQISTQTQKQNSQNDLASSSGTANANGGSSTNVASPSTPTSSGARSSRPKSASSNGNSNASGGKSKQHSSSTSSGSGSNNATFQLHPQNQPKTIFVNTNLANATANADKFIKRSLISKASPPMLRGSTNFTAKQLSDILLNPGKDQKEKYQQLLTIREQDSKDGANAVNEQHQQQRLDHVKNFYERRKRLLNTTARAASTSNPSYNHQTRQLPANSAQLNGALRERLLRTLSDCGINSIKSNSVSPNSSAGNDILRVLA